MKIDNLRLTGFKSFAETQEFVILDGLTGIVGPNGCGKSNLIDAIRWVMGENSSKSLRGGAMEDVIFAGAADRAERGFAEVLITLDNSAGDAPAGFNDRDVIEVSRRIERQSASLFRINGVEARARDVQLLFSDSATGAHSLSLVGQGEIGEIISSNAAARRRVLDEAAGITGLNSRRREAQNRLASAEQNFVRLNDLLVEIDTGIGQLRAQARKAVRYRNLSSKIREAQSDLFRLRLRAADREIKQAEAKNHAAEHAVAKARQAHHADLERRNQAAGKPVKMQERASVATFHFNQLKIKDGELEGEAQRLGRRADELTKREKQVAEDLKREEIQIADRQQRIDKLNREKQNLEEGRQEQIRLSEQAKATAEKLYQQLQNGEAELAKMLERRAELSANYQLSQKAHEQAGRDLTRSQELLRQCQEEISEREDSENIADELIDLQNARREAKAALEEAEADGRESGERLAMAEESAALAARTVEGSAGSLQKILSEQDALKSVLSADAARKFGDQAIDKIRVKPGYERALAAALGEDLDASEDSRSSVHWLHLPAAHHDHELPPDVQSLAEFVTAPPFMQRRLAHIGVIVPESGVLLQPRLYAGQRLVSLEGDLWRWDGLIKRADSISATELRFRQRNRLEELNTQEKIAQDQLAGHKDALAHIRDEISQYKATRERALERLENARAGDHQCNMRLSDLQGKERANAARLDALYKWQQQIMADCDQSKTRLHQEGERLNAQKSTETLDISLEKMRADMEALRRKSDAARAHASDHHHDLQTRSKRVSIISREVEDWRRELAGSRAHSKLLMERKTSLNKEQAALRDLPENIREQRAELAKKIAKADVLRAEMLEQVNIAEDALRDAELRLSQSQQILRNGELEQTRCSERLDATRANARNLALQVAEAMERPLNEILSLVQTDASSGEDNPDSPDLVDANERQQLEVLEARLARLKNERERIGQVNLEAESEIEAVERRRKHLSGELEDLTEAKKQLYNAIEGLDREARRRVDDALGEVNRHFTELFALLFGGGQAEVTLSDRSDPLSSGLDILACPPGKRTKLISLLSGGEEALTALALVFAVLLTRPGPICILDEVDAALDDSNVSRFCKLLRLMMERTQMRFLVVTHHPTTMANMNRLYGVTMATQGISKMVSVDLDRAVQLRTAR